MPPVAYKSRTHEKTRTSAVIYTGLAFATFVALDRHCSHYSSSSGLVSFGVVSGGASLKPDTIKASDHHVSVNHFFSFDGSRAVVYYTIVYSSRQEINFQTTSLSVYLVTMTPSLHTRAHKGGCKDV